MATLLTINKGKSLTLGFMFPDSYDMSRIKDVKVYVGSSVYPYSIAGKVITCKLTSEQTSVLFGLTKVAIWIDDNKIGGDPISLGDIQVISTNVATTSQSVNEVFDLLFNLTITEDTITIDSIYYNIVKGDSAFAIWLQQPGNAGKTEQDYFNFLQQPAIEAASTANTAATNANTVATNVETAESARITAENSRVTAENERTIAESARVTAENDRVIAESNRVTGEAGRVTSESERATAESERANAESSRVSAESGRIAAENDRATAENTRASNENTRQTNESTRQSNESTRQTNESTRQTNESTRQSNEATRQSQEASRVAAENQRVASGSIIASQSTPQTLGSSSARLTKLWATDIDSTNMPTVGGVSLSTTFEQKSNKTSDIYTNRQSTTIYPTVKGIADYVDNLTIETSLIYLRKTGDGSGIASMNVTSSIDSTVTITNGYLYTDSAGNGQTTSINITHNVTTTLYFKVTKNNGYLTLKNITYLGAFNSPTNAPIFYYSTINLPRKITTFVAISNDATAGDVAYLPRSLTYLDWRDNNKGYGDICNLPPMLTSFIWGGYNTGTGDIAYLPAGLTSFNWSGYNTGTGDIAYLPAGLTSFNWGGNNTGTGDIANLPAGLTFIYIIGNNTVYGNMYNLPAGITYIDIEGKNSVTFTDSQQSPRVWASGIRKVYLRPSAGVFTSAMTDALLISLSGQSSWANEKTIDLRGNCGARTSASNSAVSTLQGYGVTVLTN
jgi:hypothetical protein